MKVEKNKILLSIICFCSIVVLSLGVVFGFLNNKNNHNEFSTLGLDAPVNTGNWKDNIGVLDGLGTYNDPYLIIDGKSLATLAFMVNDGTIGNSVDNITYVKQIANIDLGNFYWNPIGETEKSAALGVYYEGNNYTITNLFIDGNIYQGLFGYAEGCIIKNLTIESVKIEAFSNFGGFVGYAVSSTITNCHITDGYIGGKVSTSTTYAYIGGIIGRALDCVISECSNNCEISVSKQYCGGIAGHINETIIENCYNMSHISGYQYCGGIVGYITSEISEILFCYNIGKLTSLQNYVGGIVGGGVGNITGCFNTGPMAVNTSRTVGGIIGRSSSDTLTNCYYGGECTLTKGVGSGTDNTINVAELNTISYAKNKTWLTNNLGWDFNNTWTIVASQNDGYPVLKSIAYMPWSDFAADSYAGGDGSKENPYQIATAEQLALLAKQSKTSLLSNTYFEQTAAIDFETAESAKENRLVWDGVLAFDGYYNGNFHTISNLHCENKGRGGLFLCLENGKISNIVINNSKIVGMDQVGAISGYIGSGAIIEKCIIVNSTITNKSTNFENGHVGGIVGAQGGGIIRTCIVKDSFIVSAQWEVGGISGAFYDGVIKDCALYNVNIKARERAGMFNGFGNSSAVQSSFANGKLDEIIQKIMNGNNSAWAEWDFISGYNGNYPMQKELFWLANFIGHSSQEVYDYLKNTLGFSVI